MANELLPCPFCGGEAEAVHEINGFWTVECVKCGALVDGIEAWNSRADYHGYEQAAIEAWESVKAWNSRAERTCKPVEKDGVMRCPDCDYPLGIMSVPAYCAGCGAKVVSE